MLNALLHEITFKWDPASLLGQGGTLLITLKGMVGIFIVIMIIWAFVAILNRAGKPKKKD